MSNPRGDVRPCKPEAVLICQTGKRSFRPGVLVEDAAPLSRLSRVVLIDAWWNSTTNDWKTFASDYNTAAYIHSFMLQGAPARGVNGITYKVLDLAVR